MKVIFHPKVFAEIDEIMRYYEHVVSEQLADDFYQEFRRCVLCSSEHPEHFYTKLGNYKRVNLERFPYNFLFREFDDHIRILVVRHNLRHPAYGVTRK